LFNGFQQVSVKLLLGNIKLVVVTFNSHLYITEGHWR